ncbi:MULTISPECIES: hypothetical protein [unclassified Arthrobacter]|uniref:hypothetical protein n=1 Tax=unclassified Arthrobacter TaxID=235627 RepID=UPI0014920337|nr:MULTISPECIES: hypothetical protein [unclassified Arthrobacter]MBE0008382.1 hypothetical protein [Arthrobacter sp. AET 35A]NOJ59387.1 hypothetical protein [Arthrobacter sp. 260]NOJ62121.1 hypothetical protein [Arthrobacter sp. 147(2020)]
MLEYVAVLLPSIAVGLIFYFVMRSIFNADRTEREAMARADEQQAQAQLEGNAAPADEDRPEPSR